MTKDLIPIIAAAVAAFCACFVLPINISVERSRRDWDDRQKVRLKGQDAALVFLRAAVESVDELSLATRDKPAKVKTDIHVAILQLQALGASTELVDGGRAILQSLVQDSASQAVDHERMRGQLSRFAEMARREFVIAL